MTDFRRYIEMMKAEGTIDQETANRIVRIYESALGEIEAQLRTKIVEWETIEPDEKSLYSLGLRHAEDMLKEEQGKVL